MERGSDLGPLLAAWGVQLRPGLVAGDRRLAMQVSVRGRGGQPAPLDFPLYMELGPEQMDVGSPATANLSRVILAYAGILDPVPGAGTELSRFRFGLDPQTIVNDFAPSGEELVLAARLTGRVRSAFPDGDPATAATAPGADEGAEPVAADGHLTESEGTFEALVVADADFLSDAYWTSQDGLSRLFGTVTKTADNADLLLNGAELLAGDDALISIRARGQYERPFERVAELERDADVRYRAEAQLLEEELRATEASIAEMQAERGDANSLLLTDAQVAKLEEFQKQRIDTRKQLRDVQLELRRDKERMWTRLKLFNIALWPLGIGLAAFGFGVVRRSRQRGAKR
jgi:ABC-type uncharacterized transport system involved in gliding motility auxiliary subunit